MTSNGQPLTQDLIRDMLGRSKKACQEGLEIVALAKVRA